MPRKNLFRSTTLPYHVTARTNNRESFFCNSEKVWEILLQFSFEISILCGAKIHALMLMPNHFHLLISTPEVDLGKVMEHYMRSVTKTLNSVSGRSGRVFGGPYHWTLIDSEVYFSHVYKYVYRNPVRASICKTVEKYPFSTLHGKLGYQPLSIPVHYPFGLNHYPGIPSDMDSLLSWLNQPSNTEYEQAIRNALKKTKFQPLKQGYNRTPVDLHTL